MDPMIMMQTMQDRIKELETLVESGYYEGFSDGDQDELDSYKGSDDCWEESDTKRKLEGKS